MNVSVLIPAYNCAATVQATIESVLRQTVPPQQILILDDGSTDETTSVVARYSGKVTLIQGSHQGAAAARNTLCESATGDLIAFLDADDIWHPKYLELQSALFAAHPQAVAFFTGHFDFRSLEEVSWSPELSFSNPPVERIESLTFFRRYNSAMGPFSSMSYCCVPKAALNRCGAEPFQANGAEDNYLLNLLALSGPVVYADIPLVAYRISSTSMSSNRLRVIGARVHAFELLEDHYKKCPDPAFFEEFRKARASHQRLYGKFLLGAGKISEARDQLLRSLRATRNRVSRAKSFLLLLSTFLPTPLQPAWPTRDQR